MEPCVGPMTTSAHLFLAAWVAIAGPHASLSQTVDLQSVAVEREALGEKLILKRRGGKEREAAPPFNDLSRKRIWVHLWTYYEDPNQAAKATLEQRVAALAEASVWAMKDGNVLIPAVADARLELLGVPAVTRWALLEGSWSLDPGDGKRELDHKSGEVSCDLMGQAWFFLRKAEAARAADLADEAWEALEESKRHLKRVPRSANVHRVNARRRDLAQVALELFPERATKVTLPLSEGASGFEDFRPGVLLSSARFSRDEWLKFAEDRMKKTIVYRLEEPRRNRNGYSVGFELTLDDSETSALNGYQETPEIELAKITGWFKVERSGVYRLSYKGDDAGQFNVLGAPVRDTWNAVEWSEWWPVELVLREDTAYPFRLGVWDRLLGLGFGLFMERWDTSESVWKPVAMELRVDPHQASLAGYE